MAVTTIGYAGAIDQVAWASLASAMAEAGADHAVLSGYDVTATATDRQVSVSPGVSFAAGVRAESDAATLLTFAPNNGSQNRIDYIIETRNWVAKSAVLSIKQGSSSTVPPALTQSGGSLWEMPVATVTVRPGVGQLAPADIVPRKPLPKRTRAFDPDVSQITVNYNQSAQVVATQIITDPMWAYEMVVIAQGRFGPSTGFGELLVKVNGVTQATAYTDRLDHGGNITGHLTATVGPLSGPALVELAVAPVSMNNGDTLRLFGSPMDQFSIQQIPV